MSATCTRAATCRCARRGRGAPAARRRGRRLTLALAGVDRGLVADLHARAAAAGASDALAVLGIVSDARLTLYREAAALSIRRSTKASACRCSKRWRAARPVVATRASSVPEVLGDAGVLLEPDDAAGWVASLDAIIGQPERRAALARPGGPARRPSPGSGRRARPTRCICALAR
jgi:hypothetical protein